MGNRAGYQKEYYEKNKERIKKRNAKHFQEFKGKHLARNKEWAMKHKYKFKEYRKRFAMTPLGIYRVINGNNKKRFSKQADIGKEEFLSWYASATRVCIYCGIPEEFLEKNPKFSWGNKRLSIDRLDNDKSYSLGNIGLACSRCNFIKSDLLTFDEMLVVGRALSCKWTS